MFVCSEEAAVGDSGPDDAPEEGGEGDEGEPVEVAVGDVVGECGVVDEGGRVNDLSEDEGDE
jgi:hypothetical protein